MRNPSPSSSKIRHKPYRLPQARRTPLKDHFQRYLWLYIFVIPMVAWFLIFHYAPIGGIVIAFKRYTGAKSIWESRWVGLKWFIDFFESPNAWRVIRNTLVLSLYSLLTFPLPILLALIFNEVHSAKYKKIAQTIMYAPHFISMVVLVSMMNMFFLPPMALLTRLSKLLAASRTLL